MKQFVCALLAGVFALSTVNLMADEKPEKKKRDPEAAFKKRDKDGDGKLSLEEFKGKLKGEKATKAETAFKKKDKNNDGYLTFEEFKPKKKKKDS